MKQRDQAINMNRRVFLTSTASALSRFQARAASTRPPNILMIMTDQQSADIMSCRMGDRYLRTPHMDSLAATGRVFSRAYCANPLCAPSRTSLFSGRYPTETRIETNGSAQVWADYKVENNTLDVERFPLMGTIFKRAGYATGYFGKLHIPLPEGAQHGFDVMLESSIPLKKDDNDVAGWAADFIRSKHDKPFLAVASFVNPHDICQWSQRQRLPNGNIGSPPPIKECPPRRANFAPPKAKPTLWLSWSAPIIFQKPFPWATIPRNSGGSTCGPTTE
jgi:choline-sulfatase